MPKKKKANILSQAEQSARFLEKCRELEAAGELNPTEASKRVDKVMQNVVVRKPPAKPARARGG